jgi:hypothetical protein
MVETIWATLYSAMSVSITVSVLMCGFYLIGRTIFELLSLPENADSSVKIVVGLASVTFFGWYAFRLDVSLSAFIVGAFFVAIALFIYTLIRFRKVSYAMQSSSIYVIPIFALAFSVQAMVAFNVTSYPIGTIGNNDIYDWSILADNLLGAPGYDNVYTADGGSAQQHRIDSFGTFFIIAICSKFMGATSLVASSIFTIFSLCLIGLSIFDLIRKAFCFNNVISFGISLLVSAGTFFFYIAYDNFYGQLLATFFYLTMLSTLLQIATMENGDSLINYAKRAALPAFSLIGILIVYQSGFLVFSSFAIIFCICYAIFVNLQQYKFSSIVRCMRLLLYPLLSGIFLALILVPELSIHTYTRTIVVKDALNGWPLPLIFPPYLLSLPVLKGFPFFTGTQTQYIFTLCIMIFLFIFAYLLAKRKNIEIASRFLVFAMFFYVSIGVYLFAYYLNGGIYQVWKLAAFVVLPMSFVFYASFVLVLQQLAIVSRLIRYTVAPAIVCGCIFVVVIVPSKIPLQSILNKIEKMNEAKSILLSQGIENVVLHELPYNEAMMAFNVLSGNFKLYPLVESYVQPVNIAVAQRLDKAKTRVLISSECDQEDTVGNGGYRYKILQLDDILTGSIKKYYFGSRRVNCSGLAFSQLYGFSGTEPWGIWTEGSDVRMQIDIPPDQIGTDLNIIFNVQPFGKQTGTVNVTGGSLMHWDIEQKTELKVSILSKDINQGKLTLDFHIDHPLSPKSVDSSSTDTRLLGIGFISLRINTVN